MKKINMKIIIFIVVGIIISLAIYLIYKNGSKDNKLSVTYDKLDENVSWDDNVVTDITFYDDSINISNKNVVINGNVITIKTSGTYRLSGTNSDAQIVVDSNDEIVLVLDNLDLIYKSGPVILVNNAKKTVITLNEDSNNRLEDGASYNNQEVDSTIYSKDDLTINGTGSLEVISNYENAIKCNDELKIMSGNIKINSKTNGIIGKDLVSIKSGNIDITSIGDGIKANNDTDASLGNIVIEDGNITIKAEEDGIQAENNISITNGTFNITTSDGYTNSSKNESWGYFNQTSSEESAKGIKALNNLIVENGIFVINSKDDSIHTNNDITINNGYFDIKSGDDGIHADNNLTMNNGEIKISNSYEGIEATNIFINSGSISVSASDDGFNAAGGNDSSSMDRRGANKFAGTNGTIEINGGNIFIDAAGDGIDSNGTIKMSDGIVTVEGPTNDGNGALDYERTFDITGGTLLASGSSGMSQVPSSSSGQNIIFLGMNSYYESGTSVIVKNSNDEEIIRVIPNKKFSSLVLSNEILKKDEIYIIYINNEEYDSFTISDTVTTIGNIGTNFQGGMGPGGMCHGGMCPGGQSSLNRR